MSAACHEELRENYVTCAGHPSHHPRRAHSGLRAGASPERQVDGNSDCPNPCRRDEDTNTCCPRRPTTPRCHPEPNANPAETYVDPVDQIINEGLMQQKKKSSRRRSSCSSSSRPQGPSGRERSARPSTANHRGYQPDFFDDQADMSSWLQHRDRDQHDSSRVRPSSPAPRPKCLAFEPYVDNEPYTPAAVQDAAATIQTALQDENDGLRQNMQRELARLNEQRSHLVECLETEMKIIEMMREYKKLKRASAKRPEQPSGDDRERLQRLIDEEKRKLAEFQRRPRQQDNRSAATPSGTYEIPSDSPTRNRESACATTSTQPCQRRKLSYQPPSPDTDTEDECPALPPRRRLLVVRPLSPSDSSDDANECGR